jgi:hypothetical protein
MSDSGKVTGTTPATAEEVDGLLKLYPNGRPV